MQNPGPAAHPIHLHGHNMFVLNVGLGDWDGHTVVNPTNPQRRDVQLVPAGGYLVLQITADNPGMFAISHASPFVPFFSLSLQLLDSRNHNERVSHEQNNGG
jgi:hypothetical protein